MLLDLVLRWLHILPAIILAGGLFFMRGALLPGLSRVSPASADEIKSSVRGFWAKWVMASSGLLLITGLVNAVRIIRANELPGVYHGLIAVKLVLGLLVFWLAAVLSGKTDLAKRFREKETYWLNVSVILVVAIVCVASYMRSIPRLPKVDNTNVPIDAETD
jgi:hypothetical protein